MRLTIRASVYVVIAAALSATPSAQEPATVNLHATVQDAGRQAMVAVFKPGSSAIQQAATTPGEGEHEFGLGVRTGGNSLGLGVSVRSWLQPHFGVQVGVTHYGYGDFFGVSYSSTQFSPAFLYGFNLIKVDAPLSLRPFAGGGVSIIRSSFSYFNNADTTNTGVLLLGGVELFFEKVPRLGVSGELEFTPSATPYTTYSSVGGAGFVALAHWYFK